MLGATLAYVVLRTRLPGRRLVEQVAMSAVAVPGLVLGIGLLRTYYDVQTSVLRRVARHLLVHAGDRLCGAPPALCAVGRDRRRCSSFMSASKRPPKTSAPASFTTLTRIVVPLMTGGLLAGFVTSFATAAVELSATLLLVARASDAPLAYGIYVYMQSAAGRGPGAALGVIAVVVVAIATYLAYRIAERERGLKSRERSDGPRRHHRARDLRLRRDARAGQCLPRRREGRVLRLPRAVRLRQDHAASPDRRLRHADRGRILIGDRDVTRLPPWSRNVGMVFQSYALWPHMTRAPRTSPSALNVASFRAPRSSARSRHALDLVGLSAYADRRPAQLSGGQQQRVALARTIVIEPEVLLLDEPLSNLDARLRVEMRVELRQLQRKLGITAIYVTHDQEDANAVADRIAVLDQGRIQQIGTPLELYDHPANRFVATFLGTANLIEGRDRTGGRFVADGLVAGRRSVARRAAPASRSGRRIFQSRRTVAALPSASRSASSWAVSRAIIRRRARSRSWSMSRTGVERPCTTSAIRSA